jgi:hypothetical protein
MLHPAGVPFPAHLMLPPQPTSWLQVNPPLLAAADWVKEPIKLNTEKTRTATISAYFFIGNSSFLRVTALNSRFYPGGQRMAD